MAQEINSIKNIIKDFIDELQTREMQIEKVFLFGSYAKGHNSEGSDIDVALISKCFSGCRFDDRHKIAPSIFKIDSRIDPFPFKPEDFNPSDPLVYEIINSGIDIKKKYGFKIISLIEITLDSTLKPNKLFFHIVKYISRKKK